MKKLLAALFALAAFGVVKTDTPHAERYRVPGKTELLELVRVTTDAFGKLWSELSDSNNVNENVVSRSDLLRVFMDLDENITAIEERLDKKDFYVFAPIWVYAQTEADVLTLNSYYDTFRRLQDEVKSGKTPSDLAWTDLGETYLQDNNFGLVKITDKLHHHVVDLDPSNLFETTLQEVGSVICNKTGSMNGSPYQILYNLYTTVALADYKGYVMLQFSYMILKLYEKGDFVAESKRETTKFEKRLDEKANAIRNALSNADRSMYNCDPKSYVEGVNYAKLTNLLQGYIENEVNFNAKGECWENCAAYQYTEYKGCYKQQFCSKQEPCRGKILECKYMDSDMEICKSSNPDRRYDWVSYENGVTLGNKGQCLKRNLFKVDSWWRYLFWHCSYCLCLCDGGSYNSDRYFNMRSVESDIGANKVVTGVKIVKHNRIIHLQIQQGVLGPRGTIVKSTLSWKPVDDYSVTDFHVQNGVDYHTMSWMDRTLDIDEAIGPDEHVLTGVRLRKLGSHLNLEVRVTPINFTTGEVFPEVYSTWLSNDNTEVTSPKPRREIHLTNPDIPIRYQGHRINSEHDHFIKFQASSFDHDVAQNTVPFFDTQSLISNGTPLSGLGFIHRGKPGSGGFIAPKLITYNFGAHI